MSPSMSWRREFPPLAVPLVVVLLLSFNFHPFRALRALANSTTTLLATSSPVISPRPERSSSIRGIRSSSTAAPMPWLSRLYILWPRSDISPPFRTSSSTKATLSFKLSSIFVHRRSPELLLLPFLTRQSSIVTSPRVLGRLSGSVRMPSPVPCWLVDLVGTSLLRLPRPPILLPPIVRPQTVPPSSPSLVVMATSLAARLRHPRTLTPTASMTPASRLMGGRARFMGGPSVVMGGFPPDLLGTLCLVSPASATYRR
jgi:hypothetical protein